MKISIRIKLLLLGVGCVLVTVAVMVGVGFWQTRLSSAISIKQVNDLIDTQTGQIAQDTYNLIQSQDEAIQLQVSNGLNVLQDLTEKEGGLSQGTLGAEWTATNQLTNAATSVKLPQLLLGNSWLGKVNDPAVPVPAVDKLMQLLNTKATIFQPLPDGSGILRVATNVTTAAGKRAIGTYIPAKNADGSPNAVVATVMSGKDYHGVAFVVNAWYVTVYHPVLDSNGKVFAILFVGVKEESVATLRNAILQTQVGKTGYISIIGGKGDQRGKYIVSEGGKLDGQSVWDEKDLNGKLIYQDIVNAALALKPGESTTFSIQTQQDQNQRIARVAYYASWDWIIIVNGYQSDYQPFYDELTRSQAQMVNMFLLFGLGLAIFSLIIVYFIASSMARPITSLTNAGTKLATGNIHQDITYQAKDEIGDLANAFRNMIDYNRSMAVAAEEIAKGDLTVKIVPKSEEDVLGQAFVKMVTSLNAMIRDLSRNAYDLDSDAKLLSSASTQAGKATDQIAITISQVANSVGQEAATAGKSANTMEQLDIAIEGVSKGAMHQAEAVNKAVRITIDISQMIQAVSDKAQTVSLGSSQAAEAANQGSRTVMDTIQGMGIVKQKVGVTADKMREMGIRSQEIGAIVEKIEDIASQTNLLALNAAIEAARAGEQGKGFSVVADEVRKLAERAAQSTKEISVLVKGIQNTVTDAIHAMDEGAREVDTGVERANHAGEALKKIIKAIEQVNLQSAQAAQTARQIQQSTDELVESVESVSAIIEENSAATEEMSASSGEVTQLIINIASISEENSAAVEQVSASTEEMSVQVTEVSQLSQKLSEMSAEMRKIVELFKFTDK